MCHLDGDSAVAGGRQGQLECRVLHEDRSLESLKLWARLDAELLNEDVAGLPIRVERLGLPSTAVEREHQLAAKSLTQGIFGHEPL
jgi:hypothetical protein